MINLNDTRPNYRQAVTCLNCRFSKNIGSHYVVLECQKHDNWAVEVTFVCDDHPDLSKEENEPEPLPAEPPRMTDLEIKQNELKKTIRKRKKYKKRKKSA